MARVHILKIEHLIRHKIHQMFNLFIIQISLRDVPKGTQLVSGRGKVRSQGMALRHFTLAFRGWSSELSPVI